MHTTLANLRDLTKPGIYPGVSFEDYAAIPAMNGTALEYGTRSMAHLRAYLAGEIPDKDSEALDFGIALHSAVLEPGRLDEVAATGPINPNTQAPYGRDTKKFKEWREQNPGRVVLAPADAARLGPMAEKILANPDAAEILTRPGEREVTAVWGQRLVGLPPVLCKGRIDLWTPGVALVDLKSTRSAKPEDFEADAASRGYHRKAAMYVDGWKAITGEDTPFVVIAVEKEPPYEVAVFAMDDRFIEIGRMEIRAALREYAKAATTNEWPGYGHGIKTLCAPAWLERQYEYMRSDA